MAQYTGILKSRHLTLTGTDVDSLEFPNGEGHAVDVLNRSGAGPLFVTVGIGAAATDLTDPVAYADDVILVPAGMGITLKGRSSGSWRKDETTSLFVKVLGDGNDYTVQISEGTA